MKIETIFAEPAFPHLESGFAFIYQDKPARFDARERDISTESRLHDLWVELMERKLFKRYEITLRVTPIQYEKALHYCNTSRNINTWFIGSGSV